MYLILLYTEVLNKLLVGDDQACLGENGSRVWGLCTRHIRVRNRTKTAHYKEMAAGLATPPSIDWTEDDGLYQRVQKWTLRVEDMMLGPLAMAKEPAKTRILMCWLPEKITDIVRAAGKVTENNYSKVTEFLLNWPNQRQQNTTVLNNFWL